MCLVPANSASRACVWLPNDRVRGRRGLALALMGAATSLCSGNGGGFAALEASPRRVAPLMVQFPPFGGDEVAVRGGEAPASQTPSAKNANNGGVGEAACGVVNTTMPGLVRRSHANPLSRT